MEFQTLHLNGESICIPPRPLALLDGWKAVCLLSTYFMVICYNCLIFRKMSCVLTLPGS